MLLQRRAIGVALFTFRWFGFMMHRHFSMLFITVFALLACTMSWVGVIAGGVRFTNPFWLAVIGRRKKKTATSGSTVGSGSGADEECTVEVTGRAAAVNKRTVLRETIRGKIDTEWGQSYFNS